MAEPTFAAEPSEIVKSSKELAALELLGKKMAANLKAGYEYYFGCWGQEGQGDDFADAVIPEVKKVMEALAMAVEAVDGVIKGLVNSLGAEAAAIQKPQDTALNDIQQQGDVRR
ncbi:hypothetical protein [Streptomyces sp. WG7]|uniref:hypothetical protein n=1 Tax=Streptomyces sp. WG7 TaxID=3417650 RepID=UPI003CED9E0C